MSNQKRGALFVFKDWGHKRKSTGGGQLKTPKSKAQAERSTGRKEDSVRELNIHVGLEQLRGSLLWREGGWGWGEGFGTNLETRVRA